MKPRQWYRFQDQASDPTVAEIHIIDVIGDWIDEMINEYYGVTATVTAKAFVDQLAKLPDAVQTIRVHINSPGGDVFAAANIANALRDQQLSKGRTVETYIDGLAASAASVIAMAGKTVVMADNALLMIHNPWSIALGEAGDMRKLAETLDTIRDTIVSTYQWHSPLDAAAIAQLMDAETWMTADQAIEHGFVTSKVTGLAAAASIDRRAGARLKVPEQFRDRVEALLQPAPAERTPAPSAAVDEIFRLCDEAGLSLAFARDLASTKPTSEQVTARVARASQIRALCKTAKLEQLADGYVNGGMSVTDVQAHLTTITAVKDTAEIDTTLGPEKNRTVQVQDGWKQAFAAVKRTGLGR